jgi:hypothetical protein
MIESLTRLGGSRGFLTRIHTTEDPLLEDELDDLEFDDSDEPSLLIEEEDNESSSSAAFRDNLG